MMKQYMKYIGICLCAVLAVGLTACADDEFDIAGSGDLTLKVTATTSFSGEEARAILDESQPVNISDYCLLVFDKKAADGNLIYASNLTSSDLSNTTYTIPNASKFAMLLGNVTLSQLELSVGSSKVSSLYSAMAKVNAGDNNFSDASRFTWSDCLDVSTTTNALAFNMKPNVAKVIVSVTNSSPTTGTTESVQLLNLQVRNVMNKVRYAQNALNEAGLFATGQNKEGGPSVIDYNREAVSGTTASSVWYVPVNMCGTGNRTSNIPAEATYIEVTGVRGVDHLSTAYRIYLGVKTESESYQNMTNFDVLPDKIYNVSLNISSDGLTFDVNTGVNSFDNPTTAANLVKLPSNANCHMINPNFSKTANGYPVYELPIDRIDECWGLEGLIPDASMRIGDNDEWKAVFIWQDIPGEQVMYFCDEKGSNITKSHAFPDYASLTEYYAEGKGHEPIRFKLVDTETYGNVLIGIRKNGVSDYLWSWHLWVTDYNPDAAPTPSQARTMYNTYSANGMYVENVTGVFEMDKHPVKYIDGGTSSKPTYGDAKCFGNVQHFYQYYTTKYWTGASATIWDWDKGGMYANKWIMDRNLGSQGPGNGDIENAWDAFGLYYQFGRKDPFPYINYNAEKDYLRRKVYDINGNVINKWKDASLSSNSKDKVIGVRLKSGGSFEESVKNPFTLYSGVETTWASSLSDVKSEYWYGLESGKHKSIFDPCPPGWCVPVSEAFQFATVEQPAGVYTNSNSYTNVYASFSVYVHMRGWYNTSNPEYHRNFAILTSLGCINGSASPNKHLDSVFASQGYIADDGSSIYGLITVNRKDIRGCYWTARGSGVNGEMLQFKPVNYVSLTNNKYTHSSSDTWNGNDFGYDITEVFSARFPRVDDPANGVLLYHRMNTPLRINKFVASRAQPVRCIQEPNN